MRRVEGRQWPQPCQHEQSRRFSVTNAPLLVLVLVLLLVLVLVVLRQ
jgi:hypothetical protein